jgi:hypothetical protein
VSNPIKWKLRDDPYVRKSEDLARSEVHYSDNIKMSGVVERLSQTMLKAIQDIFYDMTTQKHYEELAKLKTEEIFKRYKDIYIGKKTEKFNRQSRLPLDDESSINTIQIAEKSFNNKSDEIRRLASKEAWREVLQNEINDSDLRFHFEAQDIFSVANISDTNTSRLFEDVTKVQKKFNRWTERIFDEKTGTFAEKTINATLFPVSELIRRGHGYKNEIKVKVEKDLIHAILFLNKNFLGYHIQIYAALKEPNALKTYEVLIESLSPRGKSHPEEIDDLQKRFSTSYKSLSDFLSKVIDPSIKAINKALGTEIEIEKIREGRKYRYIRFVISKRDAQILKGEKAIADFVDEQERETFGYYIALLQYHKGEIEKNDLYDRSIDINGSTELETYAAHYNDYLENLDDFDKLLTLAESHKGIPKNFSLDYDLLTLIDDLSGEVVATTASGCLEVLVDLQNPDNDSLTKSLPGFEREKNIQLKYHDFFPFTFKATPKRSEVISIDNYKAFERRIDAAIRLGIKDQFEFDSDEKRDSFIANVMNREINTFDAEIVDKRPTLTNNRGFALDFLLKNREINKDFQKGKDKEWEVFLNKIFESSSYSEEDFRTLTGDILPNYLLKDKDGSKYYLSNIKNPAWLEKRWDTVIQKALIWHKKQSVLPENINIFDLYEE